MLQQAGLIDVAIVRRFDTFLGTSKEKTARKFGVEGVSILGRKPR